MQEGSSDNRASFRKAGASTPPGTAVVVGAAASAAASGGDPGGDGEGALPLHRVLPGVVRVRAGPAPGRHFGEWATPTVCSKLHGVAGSSLRTRFC